MTRTIALLDLETTGLDATKDHVVEVALALFSVEHRSIIRCRSWLVAAPPEEVAKTQHVHGIPPELAAAQGVSFADVAKMVHAIVTKEAQLFVTWNADFDRAWMPAYVQNAAPWADACWDIEWPKPTADRKLLSVAHAHGVQVGALHRATDDVLLVARLLERVGETHDLGTLLDRAMRPKAIYEVAARDFNAERNAQAKEHGFRWDAAAKSWRKRAFVDDVPSLPFAVRPVEQNGAA